MVLQLEVQSFASFKWIFFNCPAALTSHFSCHLRTLPSSQTHPNCCYSGRETYPYTNIERDLIRGPRVAITAITAITAASFRRTS